MAEIVPSEELRAFVRRMYEAWRTQDMEALKEMFSASAHASYIGTDPEEFWNGPTGPEMTMIQIAEVKGAEVASHDLRAFAFGNVGWASDNVTFRLGIGGDVRIRLSMGGT